jgi:hypothetical protein
MKRSKLALIISGLVILATLLWFVSTKKPINVAEIAQFSIILVLIGFGIYVGISRLKSEKRGEPAEDELSKKDSAKGFFKVILHFTIYVAGIYVLQ